jgi:membrane AbrB-like protein
MAPGASTPMILMADENGADARLVAIMHKVRTTIVVALAAIVASLCAPSAVAVGGVVKAGWFPPVAWGWLLVTLSLAIGIGFFTHWLRVFTGPMLVTLGSAIVLQSLGWIKIELPPWLLAVSYAIVGWTVGLGFTRSIVGYALRSLPLIVASSVAVIALCAALGAVMVVVGGIDPMTAYLATSPGGADSIAIIAASTTVNMRFVMAMQITRLVVVMLIAPALSRWIVRLVGGAPRLEA